MLSILVHASDAFVSKSFLTDLGNMIEMEATTVETFFNSKMVDNHASKQIEKVKWTLEEDSVSIYLPSQLFTREQIEEHTCPPDDDTAKKEQDVPQEEKDDKFIVKPTLQIHTQLKQ